jgi:TonB family protein
MYLDFQDHRPDTPHLPRSLTRLEQVLLVVVGYLIIVVTYLVVPASVWQSAPAQPLLPPPEQMTRLVHIEPLVDRPAPPKKPSDLSDLDRRTTTIERAPKPENDAPRSRGNTPEKVESAPPEESKSANAASAPPTSTSMNTPNVTTKVAPDAPPAESGPEPGVVGKALRNLQSYLHDQTFDNPQGGAPDQGPDIQFDSKGIDFGAWLRRFRAQVYHNWLIPQAAEVMHGHVVLQLNIHRDGSMTEIRVAQSSGIPAFDIAAFNALKSSNPTVALPPGYPLEAAAFTVTFYYNERIR